MKTTAISELKASLSEYLKRVKAGNEVIVTERGKPVAKIVPITVSESMSQHLREMEKEGLISVGTGKLPKDFWKFPRPKDPKGQVLKALLEEREEGR
ncbi:MAG: type II toxin-antitoxin system Phd/YefM family antitoxin [Nitrospiria bacterium]